MVSLSHLQPHPSASSSMTNRKEQVFLEAMMGGGECWQLRLPDLSPRSLLLPPLFIMVSIPSPLLGSIPFTNRRTSQGQGGMSDKEGIKNILQSLCKKGVGGCWDRPLVAYPSISFFLWFKNFDMVVRAGRYHCWSVWQNLLEEGVFASSGCWSKILKAG